MEAKALRRSKRLTKHKRVADQMRRRILEGTYPARARLPTESQLSKMLMVGKQTVVRALGELAREGLIVRRRGDGTYVANKSRPPLVAARTLRIGLLWPCSVYPERMHTHFQGAMTRGILNAWNIESSPPEWASGDERSPTKVTWTSVERAVSVEAVGESRLSRTCCPDPAVIKAGRYDAIVLLSIIDAPWIKSLLDELEIPAVVVDFPSEELAAKTDLVYVDAQPAYRHAVKRMAALGLRTIHFVGSKRVVATPSPDMSPEDVSTFRSERYRVDPDSYLRIGAWRSAMDECGLPAPESFVHFEFHNGEARLAEKLLSLPADQQPDGILCHNYTQAEGLRIECAKRGRTILTAGATDLAVKGDAWPIFVDGEELGRTAAELILWQLQNPARKFIRAGVSSLA